ncbi:phage integrase N-terminal domain-containing protein [Limnobaculum xujianqingii]|uniref:phage integrase N-terminal domain-containing protein n=1 Tax=Limnobaculum xujianqingii TaxID=2738837 RepID=UPI001E458762|nr:phage integrase N-terminal domain-containing protein [Limnobaculum xujianqingii]
MTLHAHTREPQEALMDDLTYTLRQLCQRNRDGSHATQADRLRSLTLMSRQLRDVGFRQMRATSLKGKHIEVLLQRWQTEGLSAGTLKNRLAHVRWWAEKVGKAGIIPADNTRLGIPERRFVTQESKAQVLGSDALDRVNDPCVRMSLALQQAFGLRREEAIKFRPGYADQGDFILLKGSWTKGGRERVVPLTTPQQRAVLDEAHQLVGAGSLIPAQKTYIQQRHTYDGQCKGAGLSHMHGLRHHYAQQRYEALTGWQAPAAGGPSAKALTREQRVQDRAARQIISRELGHERLAITAVYLGR